MVFVVLLGFSGRSSPWLTSHCERAELTTKSHQHQWVTPLNHLMGQEFIIPPLSLGGIPGGITLESSYGVPDDWMSKASISAPSASVDHCHLMIWGTPSSKSSFLGDTTTFLGTAFPGQAVPETQCQSD